MANIGNKKKGATILCQLLSCGHWQEPAMATVILPAILGRNTTTEDN